MENSDASVQVSNMQEIPPTPKDTPALSSKKAIFFTVILYLLFLSDFTCRIGVNTLYSRTFQKYFNEERGFLYDCHDDVFMDRYYVTCRHSSQS